MAHKTITISEDAYEAWAGAKAAKESFTDVILRILKKKQEGTLLDYVMSIEPDEEFARTLEDVLNERDGISLMAPRF
jgi:predicted CopG family antitoxin